MHDRKINQPIQITMMGDGLQNNESVDECPDIFVLF